MLAPQALLRGLVQRLLPSPFYDDRDTDRSVRFARYGEQYVQALVRKSHNLADEGSYFVCHNNQTGVISSLIGTTFTQTTLSPMLIITNTDTGDKGKSIYLDYLNLIVTVAGAAGAGITVGNFAWSIDQSVARYTSGGTDISANIVSPNSGVSRRSSVAQVNFGALTLAASTVNARTIVPQRQLRQLSNATSLAVLNDHIHMNFGGVEEAGAEADIGTARTISIQKNFALPPVVIGPQHCAILHLWSPGAALTTGITLLPEIGFWER